MPLFVRKPLEVIAEQFLGPATLSVFTPAPTTVPGIWWKGIPNTNERKPMVTTTNGNDAEVKVGDYVVREPDGNGYYPCKAEIFEAGHDPKTRPFNPATD